MRVTSAGFYLALGLGTVGAAALTGTGGCGQLWRPFLDPQPVASDDLGAAADLATPPPPPPADLGGSPWTVEPSGTTQTLYGVWSITYTTIAQTPTDGGAAMVSATHTPVYAVGAAGTVLQRSSSSGVWSAAQLGVAGTGSPTLYAITGHSVNDVMVVGDGQYSVQWNGTRWAATLGGNGPFFSVTSTVDQSSYLAVGAADGISILTSAARSVPVGYTRAQVDLTSTYCRDSRTWIGTARGELVKYELGTFSPSGLAVGSPIRAIWSRSVAEAWAVGDAGYVLHFDGTRWSPITNFPAPTVGLHGVTGNSQGEVWIVGDGGTLLSFNGTAWTSWQYDPTIALRGVFLEPLTGGIWAVGDKGTILHLGPATK